MSSETFPVSEVLEGREMIDLTTEIYEGMPVYAGPEDTEITTVQSHEESADAYGENAFLTSMNGLHLSEHGPTHTDAPFHYDPDGKSIEEIPLHVFYTSAVCVDISFIDAPEKYLSLEECKAELDAAGLDISKGDTVLFYTGHMERDGGTEAYLEGFGGLTREVVEWLAEQGVVNIGIDSPSIDSRREKDRREQGAADHFPAHQACKERDVLNTENLANLQAVAGQRFEYIGLPLRIRGGTGSPIRAVAVV